MENQITTALGNEEQMKQEMSKQFASLKQSHELEKMYRTDKSMFKRVFNSIYTLYQDNELANFWNQRLNYMSQEHNLNSKNNLLFIIIAALLAGVIAKIPSIFTISEDFFYPRNIGFIIFPLLTAYFAWINKLSLNKIVLMSGVTLLSVIFINTLPNIQQSDVITLSCVHLVLFLWSIFGFAFVGDFKNVDRRLHFLKFNGDLLVMSALILISCGILSGVTIGLFELIGYSIEDFYFENIGIFGLAAIPFVATYLIRSNPQLVGKISPVIAKIFSPLVLVMLIVYLIAMVYSGKDPYNDREFLLIFNVLLIGVMAIIFFSVAETSNTSKSSWEVWVLLLLSVVTIAVNSIALSAIVFRINEWGITPNRLAVLGSNVLILINLLMVTTKLLKVISDKAPLNEVGKSIALFLPIYFIWTMVVTFGFHLFW